MFTCPRRSSQEENARAQPEGNGEQSDHRSRRVARLVQLVFPHPRSPELQNAAQRNRVSSQQGAVRPLTTPSFPSPLIRRNGPPCSSAVVQYTLPQVIGGTFRPLVFPLRPQESCSSWNSRSVASSGGGRLQHRAVSGNLTSCSSTRPEEGAGCPYRGSGEQQPAHQRPGGSGPLVSPSLSEFTQSTTCLSSVLSSGRITPRAVVP